MDFISLKEAIEQSEDLSDFVTIFGETEGNHLCINNYVAFPIASLASHIDSDDDLEILDEARNLLGFLCLTKKLDQVNYSSITDTQHVAYLTEIQSGELYKSPYYFRYNYLLIKIEHLDRYKKDYMSTSPIWGGFHEEGQISLWPYKKKTPNLQARSNIIFPTDSHRMVAITSTLDNFSFERYLKLYHLLELGFDWDIVTQIKNLGTDLKGIGKILSNYGRDDIDLLKQTVNKCADINKLEEKLSVVFDDEYFDKAIEIFFDYEKTSNPLKDGKKNKFVSLKAQGTFSFVNVKALSLATDATQYNKLLKDITSYWIYRTRCGIAHHRIGEYILTFDDEPFIVGFMEPLIREVIVQAFQKGP